MPEDEKPLSDERLAEIAAYCDLSVPFEGELPSVGELGRAVAELRRAREFAQRVIDDEEMLLDDYEAKYGQDSGLAEMGILARALLPEGVGDA